MFSVCTQEKETKNGVFALMIDLQEIEKEELMKEVGIILNGLDGAVVTGCDLNTSADDMECLMQHCE